MNQFRSLFVFILATMPLAGLAHEGAGVNHGLLHGLSHPLGGLDHLIAMIAVGLWAKQLGGRAVWLVPSAFIALMIGGAVLGLSGVAVPSVEAGIAVSVLVLGLLITGAYRMPLAICCLLVGLFAVFHGNAHGLELPASASAIGYMIGFVMATGILHAVGIAVGQLHDSQKFRLLNRLVGTAIALVGVYLALA